MDRVRRAIERLYTRVCTVIEYGSLCTHQEVVLSLWRGWA